MNVFEIPGSRKGRKDEFAKVAELQRSIYLNHDVLLLWTVDRRLWTFHFRFLIDDFRFEFSVTLEYLFRAKGAKEFAKTAESVPFSALPWTMDHRLSTIDYRLTVDCGHNLCMKNITRIFLFAIGVMIATI